MFRKRAIFLAGSTLVIAAAIGWLFARSLPRDRVLVRRFSSTRWALTANINRDKDGKVYRGISTPVRLYDRLRRRETIELMAKGDPFDVRDGPAAGFSSDDSLLAISGVGFGLYAPSALDIWDLKTGKKLTSVAALCRDLDGDPAFRFSPDSRFMAYRSATADDLHVWDRSWNRDIAVPPGHGEPVAFSPDSRFLAYNKQGNVTVWDLQGGMEKKPLESDQLHGATAFSWSADSQSLAFAEYATKAKPQEQLIRIWNLEKNETKNLWSASIVRSRTGSHVLGGERVDKLLFSPDGRYLAYHVYVGESQVIDVSSDPPRQMTKKISDFDFLSEWKVSQ